MVHLRIFHILSIAALLASGAYGFTPLSRATSQKLRNPTAVPRDGAKHSVPPIQTDRGGAKLAAWPTTRDPKGMAPDYPLAVARIGITIASTYLTWYAQAQYSSVMESSAVTLICSMLFDKRLGQVSL